jgi:hypothetical protein
MSEPDNLTREHSVRRSRALSPTAKAGAAIRVREVNVDPNVSIRRTKAGFRVRAPTADCTMDLRRLPFIISSADAILTSVPFNSKSLTRGF